MWKAYQEVLKKTVVFGEKITALLLGRTSEDTARGKTQSLLSQNEHLTWMSLSFTPIKLGFFASFMPSSPHDRWPHRRNLLNSPSAYASSTYKVEDLVLWCDPQFISGQKEWPVSITLFCSFLILCCNFLVISALPFFVLSLSYLKQGQVVGVLRIGAMLGIHPLVKRLFITNKL